MKKNYMEFNNFIMSDTNLSLEEGYMLQVLFQFHNTERGYAFPSYKVLMQKCKTNRQAKVSKILKSLVAKGYIKIEKHVYNQYFIKDVEMFLEGDTPKKNEKSTIKGLSASQEKTLLNIAGTRERLNQIIEYSKDKARNLFAYAYRLLKDNVVIGAKDNTLNPCYNSNTPKYNGFNNFKAREYDYEALERKLLGWE